MRYRTIFRHDPYERFWRIAAVAWQRGLGPGVGAPDNYDAQLSLGFGWPRFRHKKCSDGCKIWVGPIRINYQRSYGGRFPY